MDFGFLPIVGIAALLLVSGCTSTEPVSIDVDIVDCEEADDVGSGGCTGEILYGVPEGELRTTDSGKNLVFERMYCVNNEPIFELTLQEKCMEIPDHEGGTTMECRGESVVTGLRQAVYTDSGLQLTVTDVYNAPC